MELIYFWKVHQALRMEFRGVCRTLSETKKAKSSILDVWQGSEYIFEIPGSVIKAAKGLSIKYVCVLGG